MSNFLQTRQAEEATSPFDGMYKPEDQANLGRIAGRPLQTKERFVEACNAFIGFDKELGQKVVHVKSSGVRPYCDVEC